MLSSQDYLILFSFAVVIFIIFVLGYASYWALEIRRSLSVRLYRNQALGLVLVAIATGLYTVVQLIAQTPGFATFIIVVIVVPLLLFYRVDTSMRAARRSDPLLRDTFHWTGLVRKVFWGVIVADIPFVTASFLFLNLSGPQYIIIYLLAIFSGAVFLPIAARRSMDPLLRKQLGWFGVFFVCFLGAFIFGFSFAAPLATVLSALIALTIASYTLYKSARSLAPLNRLTRIEKGD